MSTPPVIETVDAGRVIEEAARRRTFAIISHPDAGKTTLTEKLLLYAGAVAEAGSVKGRRGRRAAKSDWMELEQRRGISVTSTVLRFEHDDVVFNLLDTPGHKDFSEDTLRVLAAVDCAVILIDAARGVEPQTEQLFQVARARGIPLMAFVNKYDRPGMEPLGMLDHLSETLGLSLSPFDLAGRHPGRVPRRHRPPRRDLPPLRARHRRRRDRAGADHGRAQPGRRRRRRGLGGRRGGARARRRGRQRVRRRAVCARRVRPAAVRLGGLELRRRAAARRGPRPRAARPPPRDHRRQLAPGRRALLGARVQGPGQHGPASPRPRRVRAHLLGPLRARDAGDRTRARDGASR